MILTCPDCATSYFVDDSAVGAGRTVRCASCGVSWRAEPPPPLELVQPPDEMPVAAEADTDDGELFEAPVTKAPAEELPKVFRARAEAGRRTREAAVQGVVWAGMGAAFALLAAVGIVFRTDVVRVWPKAASAYASVGLPVNPIGLTIEDARFQHALQDGHPVLVVSGTLRNVRSRPVTIPPLSITLLDKQGKQLTNKTASPDETPLEPGQTRGFIVSFLDPPMFASDLDIVFLTGRAATGLRSNASLHSEAKTPDTAAAAAAPRAMLLGPVISEARPLPAGSPYALSSSKSAADQ